MADPTSKDTRSAYEKRQNIALNISNALGRAATFLKSEQITEEQKETFCTAIGRKVGDLPQILSGLVVDEARLMGIVDGTITVGQPDLMNELMCLQNAACAIQAKWPECKEFTALNGVGYWAVRSGLCTIGQQLRDDGIAYQHQQEASGSRYQDNAIGFTAQLQASRAQSTPVRP